MDIIDQALAQGRRALSEHEAKNLLAAHGIPVTRESLATDAEAAKAAAKRIGYPVVLKGTGADLMHKTESGVVFVHIESESALVSAYDAIAERLGDAFEGVLVQEMVSGRRELVLGLHREPQFGPCVMLGVGGVLTEVINDTVFRVAPFDKTEARDMAAGLRSRKMLEAFRGEAAADLDGLAECLCALGRVGMAHEGIAEIDINPMIITPEGGLIAVDALVVLQGGQNDKQN